MNISDRKFLHLFAWVLMASIYFLGHTTLSSLLAVERPNILIISSEDNGCELGCYGDKFATTPNIDKLASRSMRYLNAWSNAPVCAPARTALISGIWPPSLGASHMRSEVVLPSSVSLYPQTLRESGYYCTNAAKEDYNVAKPKETWDESSPRGHWRNRAPNQPFLAIFNIEISHESKLRTRPHKQVHDPAQVKLPAYHPDLPEIRQDWAQYYDRVTEMDGRVGEILNQLDQDGLADSTIVIYFGDHGSGMPRGKRWLYQSGLRVAIMISVPEKFRAQVTSDYRDGGTSEELVSFLDVAPTVLDLCQTKLPSYLDGRALMSKSKSSEREYNFGFRDRMDGRYDCSRAVRDKRFLYVRNFMPHRSQGQYLPYMYQTPTTVAWLKHAKEGKTTAEQSFFWKLKPSAELYDIQNDPDQVRNLIDNPEYASHRERLKGALRDWMIAKRDLGLMPESIMKNVEESREQSIAQRAKEDSWFPVEKIWDAADAATDLTVPQDRIAQNLRSENPCVRYWSAIGLMYRSLRKEPSNLDSLVSLLETDDSVPVQAVSCEAIARTGSAKQRAFAIGRLAQAASSPQSNYFERLVALESMVASNLSPSEIPQELNAIEKIKFDVPKRYSEYLTISIESIKTIAETPSLQTPID